MKTFTSLLVGIAVAAGMGTAVSHAKGAPEGIFILQTMFLESKGKCFDGDRRSLRSPTFGAAYMNNCGQTKTQMWFAEPAGNGHFKLKTAAADNLCLEGQSEPAKGDVLDGAVFLDECRNVSGQLWKAVPVAAEGHFKLMNAFAGNGKCLEGNHRAIDAVLAGRAFMDTCQDVSGQFWIIGGGKLVDGIPTANR